MKFRLKMTLCMLSLLSVLFGVGGSLLIQLSFNEALEREREAAYDTCQTVLGVLQIAGGASQSLDYGDIRDTLERLSEKTAYGWTALRLYDGQTTIFQDGTGLSQGELPHRPGYCAIGWALSGQRPALTLSATLEAGDKTLYLDMLRDVSSLFETRDAQLRAYRRVFCLLAALCAVLSYTLSWLLTRPLTKLSEASRAISGGQLSCRADIRSGDEIGLLAGDFNAMADSLEANITALEESVARQERFTGSFAHEVKTPMTSIIGYADLLRSDALDGDERRQAANFIFTEGTRLERLSRRLLELQVLRRDGAALSPVRPAALIEGLTAQWEPVYRAENITLACRCQAGECRLEPELVKSLLVNLWDNARKALAGRGGHITTRCSMRPDGCEITVTDDGPGIPPEALPHLTEAFYRVDKSRSRAMGGVGLGLSLCREIAALHGGELRFESRPGQGTAVTVALKGGRV